MASPNIQATRVSKAPFLPQKPEIVSIGRTSVSLYRKVDETMSDPEKALAFQHNRTALAGAECYVDVDGNTVKLGAQVYYSTFLNAIRSFYDLEEYPIDLAGIFQDHIDPTLKNGFRVHYPNYGQTRTRAAQQQRTILVDVLNALIKAENDLNHIRDIV